MQVGQVQVSHCIPSTTSQETLRAPYFIPKIGDTPGSPMSTYTPCFPPASVVPSGRRGLIPSSNSSGTSIPESHSLPKLSYSARLSRSHLALASVSEDISRPPSPTSAAVDAKRVTQLRRKFQLAVDATYRDTSSGKWGHVSEMAKLGSTRGRWQGMCSGSSAPRSLYKAHEQKDQGMTAESADPYPRPPDPVFHFREIRERVENWKANVLSDPLSQADSQGTKLNQPIPAGGVRQPSQLDFPTVEQRRRDVIKTMKRKNSPSRKGHSTSRYFRAVAAPKSPDAANRGTDMTTTLSQPQGLNVDSMLHSPAEALDEDSTIAQRPSHTTVTAAGRGSIQQVSEQFLPPSFPSYLRTSTPPPLAIANNAHFRLTKPPEIPRRDVSVSLPSPPPFPLSQAISGDPRSEAQGDDVLAPSPLRRKRSLQDGTPPTRSPTRLSQQHLDSSRFETPGRSPKPSSHKLHADLRGGNLDLSPMPDHHAHVQVIDLRQLVTSQRPRSQSRHSSLGISLTPRTKDKGKGLAMMVDISPSQQNLLSPPLSSRSLSLASSPPLRIPPLSQISLIRDGGAFAPVATSTQPPPRKGLTPLK